MSAAKYMPQIDGLRAIAVSLVFLYHAAPDDAPHFVQTVVGLGATWGVHLFFVISGYLITGILYRSRQSVHSQRETRRAAITRFYLRRSLRIFPLYYVVVLAGIAVGVSSARENWGSLLTYTLNLKMASQGWYVDHYAHFWSLSVEEQYYIVWPWIVLFAPDLLLFISSIAMLVVPLAFRYWYIESGYTAFTEIAGYIHTAFCLDMLGVGAILAMLERALPGWRWTRWLNIVSGGALVGLAYLGLGSPSRAFSILSLDLLSAIALGWVVYQAARGFPRWLGVCLEFAPVLYVGRISYGLYVYHPFLIDFISPRLMPLLGGGGAIAASLAGTLIVASLSFHLLERPLNSLKGRIGIDRRPARASTPQESANG